MAGWLGADNEKEWLSLKECAVKHALSYAQALRNNSSSGWDSERGKGGFHLFRVFRMTGRT